MARALILASPMHTLQFSSSIPMTLLFVVLSVLSILSVITFLCGSSKIKKLKAKTRDQEGATSSSNNNKNKLMKKLNSSLSNRAISMVKMISWRKVQAEEVEEEEEEEGYYKSDHDEEALWRKNILMGERCRPIDFSGKIDHDSEGTMVPYSSHHQNRHH